MPTEVGRAAASAGSAWPAELIVGVTVAGTHEIARRLRQIGQRPTPQRMMILGVLAEQGRHLTAEAIYDQVQREYPSINLSTVYRTLETFRDHGLVSETDLGGGVRQFELLDRPHHHLICLRCGDIQELPAAALDPLQEQLRATHGFQARLDHLAIFGRCRDCRGDADSDA